MRIMIYDARNAPGGGGAGCTTATYSVTANAAYGLITRLDIQGVGTWFSLGTGTFTVTNVPVGRYTVWVTMTRAGTRTLQVQMGCPVTRSYFK
ncbi:MAG: hypothetical protein HYY09_05180 [Firmicutes bacterium]|nr:hypothetical protein [Bacillota bacterium]